VVTIIPTHINVTGLEPDRIYPAGRGLWSLVVQVVFMLVSAL
jgi:hypothetical protein